MLRTMTTGPAGTLCNLLPVAVTPQLETNVFGSDQAEAINLVVPIGGSGVGDPNRILMETPKLKQMRLLLMLVAATSAGPATSDSLAALRADPSTQTWACRAAVSIEDYILPDDGSMPVIMTLAGHHGRNAGVIAMEGLPVISTEFGLRGLSLAWTWEEGSYAIYLKPATGVALHFQVLADGTVVGPESSYHCERTDDVPRKLVNLAEPTDADASSLQMARRDMPLPSDEWEAIGLAVGQCWNVGSLSASACATTVVVAFDIQRTGVPVTGSIRMVEFSGGSEADADRAFGAARRAIIRCGTKGFQLPVKTYDQWRELEATFNAEGLKFR